MTPEAIVKAARDRLADAADADRDNREQGLDDLRHLAGRQWPDNVREERDGAGRPTLTINLLAQAVRQVTGDLRRMNPAVKVLAADGNASPEVAEVIEGMTRHIESASDATAIYEGAAESAAQCGMGAFRILTDYEDPASFDQCILIRRIHNPFSVYWDPAAREPTREDADWCLITEEVERDDFERLYPGKAAVDAERDGRTEGMALWTSEGRVIVAEHFWKEREVVTLSLMPDGRVVEGEQEGALRTREAERVKVMWAKVSGKDVLEGPREFPSRYIPVVAVMGEEMNLGGEIVRTSVIRYAKDPQRLYNYWSSAEAEFVALQPKAPFIVTAKQIAGHEAHWAAANTSNAPYLPYTPDEKAPGPPQRSIPPQPSAAMLEGIARAAQDIKATTGIYDAALGNRSNETSGVAIRQRQMESDISTSIYADNMARAITHCGRILVDMIPRVYDTPRIVRIVGEDEAEQLVQVNGVQADPVTGQVALVNPLTVGRYDVRVTVGPSYSTKRQEAAESMLAFIQAVPGAAAVTGDLIAKAQDWPDAEKFAERLAKMLPAEMRDPESLTPEEQQAQAAAMQQAQAQAQMAQAGQQAQIRKVTAEAAEKEARAAVAGIEARAALAQATQGEAPDDPRRVMLELRELAARITETIARTGLIEAQTRKADADAMRTVVQAVTPPAPSGPPMRAPATSGRRPAA